MLDDERALYLQGWAIVENTTDEDWNDVRLALVSGRPISFVMDLYQPLYAPRPEVRPELYLSLRSQAVLEAFARITGVAVDLNELSEQAWEMEQQLGELLAQMEQQGGRPDGIRSGPRTS